MKLVFNSKGHKRTAQVMAVFLTLLLSATVAPAAPAVKGGKPAGLFQELPGGAKDARALKLGDSNYAPNRVLVKFKGGISASQKAKIKNDAGLEGLLKNIGPAGKKNLRLYQLRKGISVTQALKTLRADRQVAYAEPDYIRQASLTPNDPSFSQQWGLHNTGQTIGGQAGTPDADIDWPEALDLVVSAASTATVAVLDTGIDAGHPDISSKLWVNPGETAGNGIDDDVNGFIDDVNGHNWASIGQYAGETIVYFGSDAPDPYIPDVAQSFAGNGGFIKGVGFYGRKYALPASGITVSVRGSLGGPDLASVTIPPGNISSTWAWHEAQFPAPVKVNNGSQYYLVFHTDVINYFDSYGLMYTAYANNGGFNVYPDGSYWYNSGGWLNGPTNDLMFELLFDGVNGKGGLPRDENGHGTHVGGISAAAGNNAAGITGVAGYPSGAADVMPLRVLDTWGSGYDSDIIDALYYAADNGAEVINMSLGGTGSSQAFQDAVNYAYNQGVVVVAAAGNDGDTTMNYPAGYTNVIGVGATDNQDQRADVPGVWGSNYNSSVDVAAPGEDIYSTVPTYPFFDSITGGSSLNYEFFSGTSMAAPMTAGLAALVRSINPSLTPAQVQQIIQNGAEEKGAPGRDDEFGYGRINAFNSVNLISNNAPTAFIDTIAPNPANQGQSVAFTGHGTDPDVGDTIAAHNWRSSIDGQISTAANFNKSDLSVGTHTIYLKVQDNKGAWSPEASRSLTVNPAGGGNGNNDQIPPSSSMSSPKYSTNVSKTTNFMVSWAGADPSPSSGIDSFDVQYKIGSTGGWANWKTATALTSATFKGAAGKTYYFRARAKDKVGNTGNWSLVSKTIVPLNEGSNIIKRNGFSKTYVSAASGFYKGSVRYSTVAGESIAYKITGKSVALISTKGKNRSKAKIFIDGKYKTTVSAYASSMMYRRALYSKSWTKSGTHTIEIKNVSNKRFDIDGLGVEK